MAQNIAITAESNFTKGLITESNPLRFPENACTDTENCIFSITGEVTRRPGIDFELNKQPYSTNTAGFAFNSYLWKNAGGDGNTQIYVVQTGSLLLFYLSSSATTAAPLSSQLLVSMVSLDAYRPSGSSVNISPTECQFTDGNGYLFVFHPDVDPVYCIYNAGTVTANRITVRTRDTVGIFEPGVADNTRPAALTAVHQYNLQNQGWTQGSPWTATATDNLSSDPAVKTFHVQTGLSIIVSSGVSLTGQDTLSPSFFVHLIGTVTSYNSGTGVLVVNCTATDFPGIILTNWSIVATNFGLIGIWNTQVSGYPSNADIWWRFKDSAGAFNPSTEISKVTLDTNASPKGFYILEAFNQQRTFTSNVSGLTDVSTLKRPKTGTWFQGRIWYSGVDASFSATAEEPFSTWSETIYFSQIIEQVSQLGYCYQKNDPTSENFFDLLSTDGGTIKIQGCGSIYKLFPVQNGLLVFAANGIWFITGSQGIGFSATDYTITKISAVQSISGTSFVNVLGWPVFWNEEGIYSVSPSAQGGGLTVDNLCLGTILAYYSQIPAISKRYARGDYNPIDYRMSWVFRSENEVGVTSRYQFDKSLNYSTTTKAFYPYSLPANDPFIADVKFIPTQGGTLSPLPDFKYLTVIGGNSQISFSEERDFTNWVDFITNGNVPYTSFFVTGFKVHGQAIHKWQPVYVNIFSDNSEANFYKIQGIWDFANSRNSGRYSSIQLVTNALSRFSSMFRRHKIRGHGLSLQFKVTSVDGKPFNIFGWSTSESINAGV